MAAGATGTGGAAMGRHELGKKSEERGGGENLHARDHSSAYWRVASLSDLSLRNRLFMATYRYRALDPVPFARPRKPLKQARVALVTTGGVYLPSQVPFDDEVKGGDTSFREIPADADVATLGIAHKSDAFDQTGSGRTAISAFRSTGCARWRRSGEIGSLNGRALSFMGSITAPGRLVKETAPAAAALLEADGVDAAFLVPL